MTAITANTLRASLNTNAKDRVEYEMSKSAHSAANKVIKYCALDRKTLESTRSDDYFKALAKNKALRNFDFLNSAVKDNARFNVYAIEKVFAKLDAISVDVLSDASANKLANKFCVASVLACIKNADRESFSFTRKHALAMLSTALKFETVSRSDFARKFDVAATTATTQVSSSFRALEALDVLRFDESSRERSVVSKVNLEHAFVKLVRAKFDLA